MVQRQVADTHAATAARQAELDAVRAAAAAERDAAVAYHAELQRRFDALQQLHDMR